MQNDDTLIESLDDFLGERVIVTEKMDGENTSMYRDYIHARSVDGRHHPSRNWVKALHGEIKHSILPGWRICGENLYAKHSIAYEDLPSYFMVFSIWDDENGCWDWDYTKRYCAVRNLITVPVLYDGIWDEDTIRSCYRPGMEGYVVRRADGFEFDDFRSRVAKYVRAGHVQTSEHWMHQAIVPNQTRN